MPVQSEEFVFSPDNFLIVARSLFVPAGLRALRDEIAKRMDQSNANDERARVARSAGVAPDEVRLSKNWYDIWSAARIELFTRHVPQFTQAIFPPQIRTVNNVRSLVPWHQDAAYMKALGERGHRRVITCFVPLEESTVGKPLVEFAIRPNQGPEHHVIREDLQINKFDLPEEGKPAKDACRRFDLRLGDAFVFGQHVLHRSYAADNPKESRTSMEFRLTTKDDLIRGKDYFDISKGNWYVA